MLEFLLLVGLFLSSVVSAEQRELQTDTRERVDAVLLLDGSGSMLKTDPLRLRDEGAKLFVQFLKPGDRLSIIEFSAGVKTIRPLSDYDKSQTQQISDQLGQVSSSGLYTDLLAGLKAAQGELKANLREDARPIIVLLSDGKEEPDPIVGTATVHTSEITNSILPSLKSEGIRVHTVYFSELADKDLLSEIALGSDGVHWFTPSADKLHESFAELFLVVKKPQIVPLAGKAFTIDEDIDEATFYLSRDEGSTISLEQPDGTLVTPQNAANGIKWYSGTKFEVITVDQPKAGKWKLMGLSNADGFATVLTDLKLITEWPTSFNAKDTVTLQARLYEEKRPVTLPQMTGSVQYGFQIIPTDKISEPIMRSFLVDNGEEGDTIPEDGIYSKSFSIEEPGDYKLTIVAKGPTFTRHQQIPFRVKPRLLTLRVGIAASHTQHQAASPDHHADKTDSHKNPSTSEESHGDTHHAQPPAEHSHGESHGAQETHGQRSDVFEVVLSQEASQLKGIEVKLTAVSQDKKRFGLPLTKTSVKADPLVYQAAASLLPAEGAYQLEATLTGVTTKKESVHAKSEPLKYVKVFDAHATEEHELVARDTEKPAAPESVLPGILIVTLFNIIAAVGTLIFLQKIIKGGSMQLPTLAPLEPIRAALADMNERVAVTVLDLSNPRFSGAAQENTQNPESQSPITESAPSEGS